MNGTAAISRLTDGLYAFVAENDKHAPEIRCGDLVLVNFDVKGFTEPGFYMMGSFALARCELGSTAGMVRHCRGEGHKTGECTDQIFEKSSDGRVERIVPWLTDATPELIDQMVRYFGIPMVDRSKQPMELEQVIGLVRELKTVEMAGATL